MVPASDTAPETDSSAHRRHREIFHRTKANNRPRAATSTSIHRLPVGRRWELFEKAIAESAVTSNVQSLGEPGGSNDVCSRAFRSIQKRQVRNKISSKFKILASGVVRMHPKDLHELLASSRPVRATSGSGGGSLRRRLVIFFIVAI